MIWTKDFLLNVFRLKEIIKVNQNVTFESWYIFGRKLSPRVDQLKVQVVGVSIQFPKRILNFRSMWYTIIYCCLSYRDA